MDEGFFEPLIEVSTRTPPTTAESQYLASKQDIIRQIIAASKIEYCRFSLDENEGLNVGMPHLASVRQCALLLQYDAHRMIQSATGAAGASERLAALVRVARHAGSDTTIIARLVSLACLSIAEQSIISWADRIREPKLRSMLLAELRSVQASGVLDMREVLAHELAMTKHTINSGQAYELLDGQSFEVPVAERAAVIDEVERVFAAVEKVWPASDAEQQIKSLIESVRNPRSRVFVAGLDMFRRQCSKGERELQRAIAAVDN